MPRQTRSQKAKGATPIAPVPTTSRRTRSKAAMGTIQEYAITCPCCGLMAPFKLKVPGSDPPEYVDRFTGEPFEVKLFSKHYGGKEAAPEDTPIGRGNKAAKGILNYTDVTESEPGVLADVLGKIKQSEVTRQVPEMLERIKQSRITETRKKRGVK